MLNASLFKEGKLSLCERAPRQHYCVMDLNEIKQVSHNKTTRPVSPAET